MKLMLVLGTRPEIIRLSRIIPLLDQYCDLVVVHTGQNYDRNLNELFFDELEIRTPDHFLKAKGLLGEQIGTILAGCEKLISDLAPDRFLVLGDTNSSLGAVMAKRMQVPVYHMEAGNRCYDDRVPEEVNRRIIDHSSDVLMPYSERSRQNLLAEGIAGQRIFVTGNPIYEVMKHYEERVDHSSICETLEITPDNYFLVTLHRAENVDASDRLCGFVRAFSTIAARYDMPVIVSTHPRTRNRLAGLRDLDVDPRVRFVEPFGFFDFVHLEKHARCVMSDSGTVQEECAILGVRNLTLRDTTERPETIECGSATLTGGEEDMIVASLERILAAGRPSSAPPEYLRDNVSSVVANILLGYAHPRVPGQ